MLDLSNEVRSSKWLGQIKIKDILEKVYFHLFCLLSGVQDSQYIPVVFWTKRSQGLSLDKTGMWDIKMSFSFVWLFLKKVQLLARLALKGKQWKAWTSSNFLSLTDWSINFYLQLIQQASNKNKSWHCSDWRWKC